MPIGGPTFSAQTSNSASVLGQTVGGAAQVQAGYASSSKSGGITWVAPMLLIVVAAYLIWAVLIQHERLQESLRPANVAVNLHNILVVGFTAAIFLVMGKLASAKLVILAPGKLTGAIAQFFQAT